MIDIILGLLIVSILGFAARGTWKQTKSGGCAGCSGCQCGEEKSCPK